MPIPLCEARQSTMGAGVRLAALFTALACAAEIEAQTIRGRVVDGETGSGVPGATLRLIQGSATIVQGGADPSGRFEFSFRSDSADGYRVEVIAQGYELNRSEPFEVAAFESLDVELRLFPAPIPIEPFLVEVDRVDLRYEATYEGLHYRRAITPSVGRTRIVVRGDPELEYATRVDDVLRAFFVGLVRGRGTVEGASWYLDGRPIRYGTWLAEWPVDLVEGVEYYGPGCRMGVFAFGCSQNAVVMVWTRHGANP